LKQGSRTSSFLTTAAGSIFILLAIVVSLPACQPNKPEKIKELTNREELPSLTLKELTSTITDSGKVKYRFITPEMQQFDQRKEPTIEFPKGLHLYIFNDLEEIDAQIKCKEAIYYQNDDLWELRNDVEAVNTNAEVINTELLFWDAENKTIYSDQFIKITTETEIITGHGFESDERMENYKIKNISGILQVEEAQLESGQAENETSDQDQIAPSPNR
jgi:LPS export ABC transporter protein LptC